MDFDALENGSALPFHDWPHSQMPAGTAGVYTVWRGAKFVYAGMASKNLYSRLRSHASGRRSGDQFCVYVCDRFVIPVLTADELRAVGSGTLSLDQLTRDYISRHLSFRFIELPDATMARTMEGRIREGELSAGPPLLNPV